MGRVVDGSDAPLQLDWVNNHIDEMIGIWRQPGSNTLQLVDRIKASSRLGINPRVIESTLHDAFGQRYVTEIYAPLNTYRVAMEVAPAYQEDLSALSRFYVHGSGGLIPVSQFADLVPTTTTVSVNHQGKFPAVTLSFNPALGTSLGDAVNAINQAAQQIGLAKTV